jgi:two-component system phosphate regulon sensor histidine kinase PhoR
VQVTGDQAVLYADKELLNQVWANLLSNSIKYTPEGGKIQVQVISKPDMFEMHFSDSGEIFKEEDKEKILNHVYKLNPLDDSGTEELGLGLAVTKKIIEKHNGSIHFLSNKSQGTTFVVLLPKDISMD